MPVSETRVRTEKADRYANRLCKHFGHKTRAERTPPEGLAEFPDLGTRRMKASAEEPVLVAETPNAARLDKLEEVVGPHPEQFAKRDGLTVGWRKEDGPP